MSKVCVIGMGFVGIPLALAFDSTGRTTVGFDIDQERVHNLRDGRDPTDEVSERKLRQSEVEFTTDTSAVSGSDYVVITVPTPIDGWKRPDLDAITSAGRTVGEHLSPGATVVLESTVYPGATREVLLPALESASGLEAGRDFTVGYSPERLAPGPSDESQLRRKNKIVSAQDEETLDDLVNLYESIIDAAIHPAPNIETAEASKCLENVQRDVNIGLINEFVMGCQELDIDIDPDEVLEAARTKPAFHDYRPGLVGGHCIPVDPHFLVSRFNRSGYHPEIMANARKTNESFPKFLAESVVKNISRLRAENRDALEEERRVHPVRYNLDTQDSRVLILGFAYKPNVNDTRNEALSSLIDELESYQLTTCGHDPLVNNRKLEDEFGVTTLTNPDFSQFDSIIVTALHDEFRDYDLDEYVSDEALPYVLDLTGHFGRPTDAVVPRKNVS